MYTQTPYSYDRSLHPVKPHLTSLPFPTHHHAPAPLSSRPRLKQDKLVSICSFLCMNTYSHPSHAQP